MSELKPKVVVRSLPLEPSNAWTLAAVSGGLLLLYSLSRIISLQTRVRDLESRPPVDDIIMRGMIRAQITEMVGDLEQSIRARHKAEVKSEPKPETKVTEVKEVKVEVKEKVRTPVKPVPVEEVKVEVAEVYESESEESVKSAPKRRGRKAKTTN